MITVHLMLDVLRSTSTVSGELFAMISLTTETHKSPVSCSDLGEFVFDFTMFHVFPSVASNWHRSTSRINDFCHSVVFRGCFFITPTNPDKCDHQMSLVPETKIISNSARSVGFLSLS